MFGVKAAPASRALCGLPVFCAVWGEPQSEFPEECSDNIVDIEERCIRRAEARD
jgi:hypothetical protein